MASEAGPGAAPGEGSGADPRELEFDVAGTVAWARTLGLKRVALQLADGMLGSAAWLALRMRAELGTGCNVFILADSSVSSWDPDVVAAQHVDADGLVMYGRASQAQPTDLPVRVVHGRQTLDVAAVVAAVQTRVSPSDRLVILPAGAFAYRHGELLAALQAAGFERVAMGEVLSDMRQRAAASSCGTGCGCRGGGGASCSTCGHCSCSPGGTAAEPADAAGEGAVRIGNFQVSAAWLSGEGGTGAGGRTGEEGIVEAVYIGEKGEELTRMVLENPALRFHLFAPAARAPELAAPGELLDCAAALKRRYFLMMKCQPPSTPPCHVLPPLSRPPPFLTSLLRTRHRTDARGAGAGPRTRSGWASWWRRRRCKGTAPWSTVSSRSCVPLGRSGPAPPGGPRAPRPCLFVAAAGEHVRWWVGPTDAFVRGWCGGWRCR